MKSFHAFLILLALLLLLCACGKEPVPTTTAPPQPTTTKGAPECVHSYTPADCEQPKTCKICGITRGSALGHDYLEGVCSRCGQQDATYRPLVGSDWKIDCVHADGSQLERIVLRFYEDGTARFGAGIYDRLADVPEDMRDDYTNNEANWYDYSGEIYYYAGFGVMDVLTYTVEGNIITCTLERDETYQMILERVSGNMLKVTYYDTGFCILYLVVDDILSCND